MEKSWVCRDYRAGDENQILALNNEFNKTKMSLDHWKWKFASSPFGKAIIKLLFDGEKLIGHRGSMPMVVSIQGRDLPTVQTVNNLVHPDYRRRGISTYLAGAVCEEAKERGIKFMYNFINPDSYLVHSQLPTWEILDQRSVWWRKLSAQSPVSLNDAIKETEAFDYRVDRLWGRVKKDYIVVAPRTAKFLNWRFAQHPTSVYSKFIIEGKGEELLGYLVLKIYRTGDEVRGHIIDMLCLGDADIVKSLLEYSYAFFSEKGVRNLSCWMPESSFYASALRAEGFAREMIETRCGLWVLDKQDRLVGVATDIRNWHITMGDSDVY